MFHRSIQLKSGHLIQNIRGTRDCLPQGYSSWKEFYRSHATAWPRSCRVYGCGDNAYGGAHVAVYGEEGVFIVPMCRRHNSAYNDDVLPVNEGTIAVAVSEDSTTGPPDICY